MIYLVGIDGTTNCHLAPLAAIKIISFNHKIALEIKLQFVYCRCALNFIIFILVSISFPFDAQKLESHLAQTSNNFKLS